MTKKRFLILVVTLFTFISGCKNQDDVLPKNTINVNIGNEPPTLDWSLATDGTSFMVLNNIMEGLTKFGDDFSPEPALAESWETSEDGKTYIFKIREGVLWTDGKPLKLKILNIHGNESLIRRLVGIMHIFSLT